MLPMAYMAQILSLASKLANIPGLVKTFHTRWIMSGQRASVCCENSISVFLLPVKTLTFFLLASDPPISEL